MIDRATRFSTVFLTIALLAAACGSSRPAGSASDASDVGSSPSDAGAEKGQDVSIPMDTGVDTAQDVPVTTDTGVDTPQDVPVPMDTGGAEVPAACGTIPTTATLTSHLRITADNECDVYVNGTMVGSTNNWGVAVTIDVSLYVHPGRKNVIAVHCHQTTGGQSMPSTVIAGRAQIMSDTVPSPSKDTPSRTPASVRNCSGG